MGSDDECGNSYRPKKKLTRMERLYGQRRYNVSKPQSYGNLLTKNSLSLSLHEDTTNIKTIQPDLNSQKFVMPNNANTHGYGNDAVSEVTSPVNTGLPGSNDETCFFDIFGNGNQVVNDSEMGVEEDSISLKSVEEIDRGIKSFENNFFSCTGNKRLHNDSCDREPDNKVPRLDSEACEKKIANHLSPIKSCTVKKNKSKIQPHHELPKFVTASNKDPTTIDQNSIRNVAKNEINVSKEPIATSLKKDPPTKENKDDDDTIIREGPLKGCEKHLVEMIEREVMHVSEEIPWNSISGLEREKCALMEAVVWPMTHPEIFDRNLRKPDKGILLFGPPGTGKTMLAKCVASQSKATFFNVSSSSLASKWHGEAEKLVRTLFTVAEAKAPSVVFIDEIDSFLSKRSDGEAETARKVKTEFLIRMDGMMTNFMNKRVMVLAASNKACEIDEAARRRFTKRLLISLPAPESRKSIISKLIKDEHVLTKEEFDRLVDLTEGFSGADVSQLCTEASMYSIREMRHLLLQPNPIPRDAIRKIRFSDFELALKTVRATVSEDEAKSYNEFAEKFASNFRI